MGILLAANSFASDKVYKAKVCEDDSSNPLFFILSSTVWSISNKDQSLPGIQSFDDLNISDIKGLIAGKYDYDATRHCFAKIMSDIEQIDPPFAGKTKNNKDTLKKQEDDITKNIATLEEQNTCMESNINALLTQEADKIFNINALLTLEGEISTQEATLKTTEGKIETAQKTLTNLLREIENKTVQLTSLTTELEPLDKMVAGLITKQIGDLAHTVQQQHKDVIDKVNAINDQTQTLKTDLDALRTREIRADLHDTFEVRPFKFGRSDLTNESKAALDNFVNKLDKEHLSFEIQGHTDQLGASTYNLDLGRKRAETVLHYLLVNHNIPVGALSISSHGKENLASIGKSRSDRSENRRVTLRVYKVITTNPGN